MLAQDTRYKFSVSEYLSLFAQGIVSEIPKTELINGEIIELSPLGHRHAKTQRLIQQFIINALNTDEVYLTGSIIAGESNMPEPDVYVLKPNTCISGNYPTADQVEMVVEVSDSTLRTDLINDGTSKLAVYASAGIPHVWVVDINNHVVHDFESPEGSIYKRCKVHTGQALLNGQLFPVDKF